MDVFPVRTLLLLLSLGVCVAQDALPHGPVYVVLGNNVTINTTVDTAGHFITITWSFNGGEELVPVVTVVETAKGTTENVGEGYEGRVSVNKANGVLTLGPVTPSDNGDYSVNMVDGATALSQTGEVSLRVLVPVSKVEIKPSLKEAVETNSTVTLNCSALGSFLEFTWTNRTGPLVADGKRITITDGELWSSVTIVNVQRWELSGPIFCTAANKLEKERSAPFNMSVHYGPEAVVMTARPAAVGSVLKKGSNVTLSCSALSSPPATLSWFHNSVALPGKTGPTMVLSDVSEEQGGTYHCSAHNPKTLRTVAAPSTNFTVLEAISGIKITPPKVALTAGDTMLNFTCVAAAGTVSSTVWTKDSKPLVVSERVAVAASGSPLMIKMLRKEDRGEYTCQLTNAVNTQSASYKMVIFYGPDGVTISGSSAVEINNKVTLKCNVDSFPAPEFKWRFNGTYLAGKMAEHTITKAAYKDTGVYTCEVANARTNLTGSSTFQLAVKAEGALDEGLTGGAIAGIVIGVLAALALTIVGVIYCKRKQTIQSPY